MKIMRHAFFVFYLCFFIELILQDLALVSFGIAAFMKSNRTAIFVKLQSRFNKKIVIHVHHFREGYVDFLKVNFTLIPKKNAAFNVRDLVPISLIHCIIKIIFLMSCIITDSLIASLQSTSLHN